MHFCVCARVCVCLCAHVRMCPSSFFFMIFGCARAFLRMCAHIVCVRACMCVRAYRVQVIEDHEDVKRSISDCAADPEFPEVIDGQSQTTDSQAQDGRSIPGCRRVDPRLLTVNGGQWTVEVSCATAVLHPRAALTRPCTHTRVQLIRHGCAAASCSPDASVHAHPRAAQTRACTHHPLQHRPPCYSPCTELHPACVCLC